MANHAMIRTDNLAGTVHGKYLVSIRMTEALDNGCIVVPGAYEAGAREVRTYTAPEADTPVGKIAILASEEVNKEVTFDTVGGFYNKAGTIARGYILEHGDIFSVTAEAFDAVPAVGNTIEVKAGTCKLAAAESATGATAIGECIAIELDGATTWYVVRV